MRRLIYEVTYRDGAKARAYNLAELEAERAQHPGATWRIICEYVPELVHTDPRQLARRKRAAG